MSTPPKEVSPGRVTNALSIDVEDYFQVSAFAPFVHRDQWAQVPCRVERNVDAILQLLDESATHATFFTLGWIAERYPQVVRAIARAGHEVASHGYAHERVTDLDPVTFARDIKSAKALLEDVAGTAVKGYRAPSFSINVNNSEWAQAVIDEAGYLYSSSIYPVRHDHYGIPDAPRFPFPSGKRLLEIPISTVRILNRNFPAGGGGFFRLLPYSVSRWGIAHINRTEAKPCIFYFHPWEIDPGQPRIQGLSARARFRHYLNLNRMQPRLKKLLGDFRWDRVDRVFLGATHA